MRSTPSKWVILSAVAAVLLLGCSEDEGVARSWEVSEGAGDETTYGEESDVIITSGGKGDTGNYVVTGAPPAEGDPCVQVGEQCVDLADVEGRYCDGEGAQADVVVDENGEVLEVICYPPPESGAPIEEVTVAADGSVTLPQNANGQVIVFDEASNGQLLKGDVVLEAERTTLYGNGVGETILDGNLKIASNNARVRGVTVLRNLTVEGNANNTAVTFCEVRGDVEIKSNGSSLVNCVIYGDLKVSGNDATLVNVGVQGKVTLEGSGATCQGNYAFEDGDGDFVVSDDEIGEDWNCQQGMAGNR